MSTHSPESPSYMPPLNGYKSAHDLDLEHSQSLLGRHQQSLTERVANRRKSASLLKKAIPVLSSYVSPSLIEIEAQHSDNNFRRLVGVFRKSEIEVIQSLGWSLGRLDVFGTSWHPSEQSRAKDQYLTISRADFFGQQFFGHARLISDRNAFNVLANKPSDALLNEKNVQGFMPIVEVYDSNGMLPIDKPDQISQAVGRLLLGVGIEPESKGFQSPPTTVT